eukprot:scaffold68234_cov26-Tisochrysis_lutea.AAC.4
MQMLQLAIVVGNHRGSGCILPCLVVVVEDWTGQKYFRDMEMQAHIFNVTRKKESNTRKLGTTRKLSTTGKHDSDGKYCGDGAANVDNTCQSYQRWPTSWGAPTVFTG